MEETNNVEVKEKEVTPAPLVAEAKSRLMVVGIGNIGINALIEMTRKYDPIVNPYLGLMGVEPNRPMLDSCFAPSKDKENLGHLEKWLAPEQKSRIHKIQLGDSGLGAGGDPEVGRKRWRDVGLCGSGTNGRQNWVRSLNESACQ
jgi:hypothetical protein